MGACFHAGISCILASILPVCDPVIYRDQSHGVDNIDVAGTGYRMTYTKRIIQMDDLLSQAIQPHEA